MDVRRQGYQTPSRRAQDRSVRPHGLWKAVHDPGTRLGTQLSQRPLQATEKHHPCCRLPAHRTAYRRRNVIERMLGRLKIGSASRRHTTGFAVNYLAAIARVATVT